MTSSRVWKTNSVFSTQFNTDIDLKKKHGEEKKENIDSTLENSSTSRFTEFSEGVSIVGFKYVFLQGAHPFRRIVWTLLLLLGFVFLVYQVQGQFREFLLYKTNVNIRVNNNRALVFPTVTICDENVFRRSVAQSYGRSLCCIEVVICSQRC